MLSLPNRYLVIDRNDNKTIVFQNTYKIWDLECFDGFIDIWSQPELSRIRLWWFELTGWYLIHIH